VLSNHVWELPEICHAHGFVPPLTEVLTSARLGVEKPHPEAYEAAIAAAGCAASEILFVGDTYEADVAGPERAGMQALLVRRPHAEARRYADDLRGVLPLLSPA
jgi:putative hydrolase of the HAD superfamily